MVTHIALALTVIVCAIPPAEPPTDAQVAQAATRYEEQIKRMQADGTFNPGKLGRVADDSLAGIDVGAMRLEQIESLMESSSLHYYTSKANEFDARLSTLSADATVEGARAAVARLGFLGTADMTQQRTVIEALVNHPKVAEALADGELWGHFGVFAISVHPEAIRGLTPRLIAIGSGMPETMPVLAAALAAPALFDAVAAAGATPAEREPLRARVVAVLRGAREAFDPADPSLTNISFGGVDAGQYLDQQIGRLEGPSARGTLVGGPAPELTFEWASGDRTLKSLADLRGKVVVLDFWATWCGPCVASFPKMREAAARYRGFGVEIVGVTSLQGHHNEDGKTIDCDGDAAREYALMGDYVRSKNLTWTVAFAREAVFNPDYGVRGIPHVVIIDAQGVVRQAKVRFHGDLAPLYKSVDALLVEAGLPTPP